MGTALSATGGELFCCCQGKRQPLLQNGLPVSSAIEGRQGSTALLRSKRSSSSSGPVEIQDFKVLGTKNLVLRTIKGSPPSDGEKHWRRSPGAMDGRSQENPQSANAVNPRRSLARIQPTPFRARGSEGQYVRPDQTIILLDWDDTLCPSHWVRQCHLRPGSEIPKECQQPLQELAESGANLLTKAMALGKVSIVTNATHPWVHNACRTFMPSVMPFLKYIPVIYAKSVYDQLGVEAGKLDKNGDDNRFNALLAEQGDDAAEPQKWKELAFEQEISGFYARYAHQSWKNVLSVGDSIFERDAVRRVVLCRQSMEPQKRCRTKTIKLMQDPSLEDLIAQVRIVCDVLSSVVQHDGDLDVELFDEAQSHE